jgi:hypothetical protein
MILQSGESSMQLLLAQAMRALTIQKIMSPADLYVFPIVTAILSAETDLASAYESGGRPIRSEALDLSN